MTTEDFRAVYDSVYGHSEDQHRRLAHIKRLLDCVKADEGFRTALIASEDPAALARSRGCEADPSDLRPFFDPQCSDTARRRAEASSSYQAWRAFIVARAQFLDLSHKMAEAGGPPEFLAWRRRQIRRLGSEVGRVGSVNPHAVATIELSRGCTVGCKFCGVSAKPFGGHLAYDGGGQAFWRTLLGDLREVLGASSQAAFCYWATDPLDNPDYLHFMQDFRGIIGVTPQTTTAIPLRNLPLTRSVLDYTAQERTGIARFSILSLNVFNRVLRTFSPEEMLAVEFAFQNPQAAKPRAIAGRNREPGTAVPPHVPATIACVSGFLINAVDCTVQLISPTVASDRWPDGYIVFGRRTFEADGRIASQLRDLIREHATSGVELTDVLRLRPDLTYEPFGAGFVLRSARTTHSYPAYGQVVGRLMEAAAPLSGVIAAAAADGTEPAEAFAVMEGLYNAGLLERQPTPA